MLKREKRGKRHEKKVKHVKWLDEPSHRYVDSSLFFLSHSFSSFFFSTYSFLLVEQKLSSDSFLYEVVVAPKRTDSGELQSKKPFAAIDVTSLKKEKEDKEREPLVPTAR